MLILITVNFPFLKLNLLIDDKSLLHAFWYDPFVPTQKELVSIQIRSTNLTRQWGTAFLRENYNVYKALEK